MVFQIKPNFFIASNYNLGKIVFFKVEEYEEQDLPWSFTYNEFYLKSLITSDAPKVHFLEYLGNDTIARVYGGYFDIIYAYDKFNPIVVKNATDSFDSYTYELNEPYIYSHPNKSYFLFYTKNPFYDYYSIEVISKIYNYRVFYNVSVQSFEYPQNRGIKMTQINSFVYMIPYALNGYSLVREIQVLFLNERKLYPTDVKINKYNSQAVISSCEGEKNYLFSDFRKREFVYLSSE